MCRILALLAALPLTLAAAPVSLDTCRAAARADNPGLAAASRRAAAAEQAVRQARSAYYPQLKAAAQWVQTDNPPQAFFMRLNQRTASLQEDFNQPDDTDNLRLTAGAAWRLYDFGQREAQTGMARAGAEAQRALLDAARNDLDYQVTRAFYSTLQAEAFLEVQRESVSSLEENLRIARERFAAGSAVRTDALNLEVKLAEAREDLIRARNGLELARAALNTAIGRELVAAGDILEAPAALPARPALPAADEIDRRGELRAAQAALRVREAVGSAQGAPAVRAGHQRLRVATTSTDDGTCELRAELPGGRVGGGGPLHRRPQPRRGRAGAGRGGGGARRPGPGGQRAAAGPPTGHAGRGRGVIERVDVAGKSLASAEEALRITRERYQQGAADITELLTAQVGRTATRTRLAAARYDYLIARSNLERAQGLGWAWRSES
jgi:outer membrane protein